MPIVKVNLSDEQQVFAEADAAALGMTLHEYLRMVMVEQAELVLAGKADLYSDDVVVSIPTFH
jgi:hypothetical protein